LPPASTREELRDVPRGDARVRAGAAALCRRLGWPDEPVLFEAGSLPVFAVGDGAVLKLFPGCFAHECDQERSVLERLDGALPVRTPGVLAEGELDGWRYLVMERLRGTPLDRLWPSLPFADRCSLARQVGRLLAALHRVDPGALAIPRPEWPRFVLEQTERCAEAQQRLGLAPSWLEQLPGFLRTVTLPVHAPPVLLHTEIMGTHLFAEPGAAGWSLSGVIDFEPAMVGAAEYEFASVGVFLTRGDGPALRALLLEYGYPEPALGIALQRRFLAYTLLHRYSNLRRFLATCPPPAGTETLDALAGWWWALT
jgi:hygromycin-B 7''-O-kinase